QVCPQAAMKCCRVRDGLVAECSAQGAHESGIRKPCNAVGRQQAREIESCLTTHEAGDIGKALEQRCPGNVRSLPALHLSDESGLHFLIDDAVYQTVSTKIHKALREL